MAPEDRKLSEKEKNTPINYAQGSILFHDYGRLTGQEYFVLLGVLDAQHHWKNPNRTDVPYIEELSVKISDLPTLRRDRYISKSEAETMKRVFSVFLEILR